MADPASASKPPVSEGAPSGPERYPPKSFLVVGIGASAGGLDAARGFVSTLPARSGLALILVQHLDPTHASMMVDLLAGHTPMTVAQAAEGMEVERDHLYVIPPGNYLSVEKGTLHLSPPLARHGTRLPFDFLLNSLAENYGDRAVCVVLSGTGADGSLGLLAIKAKGGLVIAQDPREAQYDGMPRKAVASGGVDLVLPLSRIADAVIRHATGQPARGDPGPDPREQQDESTAGFDEIIALLKARTAHDFSLYKPGTLRRRVGRRMAMAALKPDETERYIALLQNDPHERELLATDLLINVTSFFRDPKVFDALAATVIPELVRTATADNVVRIWVAGCSTGEETYSLAMLFRDELAAARLSLKLQFFASDVDPDAIATARDGLYPDTIAADVSAVRLARYFIKEERGYRVVPDLRAAVVFTVQNVLVDPPFSRIDLISCRNLLIYLRPEAQARVVSLFHFALRAGGVLLLGSSETVGNPSGRFDVISKAARLYRRIGRSRPGELGFGTITGDGTRLTTRPGPATAPLRHATFAELARRLVMESYAPATALINRRHEILYSLGPTDRYLRVATGHPSHDLLAMVQPGVRTRLREAVQRASAENIRLTVSGGRTNQGGKPVTFSVVVQPVLSDGEDLLLLCFVDAPKSGDAAARPATPRDLPRIAELEQELDATKTELHDAIRSLESSSEEQKAINEEALSVNEEYQSTNEELLTSKEELQSLNEELTALNGQLQETLERERTTANDLQNILYSTAIATLFLDRDLHIRFFTPATRALFSVIPGDIGRPLADLNSLASDAMLLSDARDILHDRAPVEREIETSGGEWYVRRVLPYRTHDNKVDGVVVTFTDITERKRAASALENATHEAELANIAKSRFLAAASHDLRQPLQTLALLQGLLARKVEGEAARKLVALLDPTLSAMSGMLNTLLDINQIDAGNVRAEMASFPLDPLLARLRDEFVYHAEAQGLGLRVVPCGLSVTSDPRLLEQMLRNLLSNALKYTKHGKVLLGCRRQGDRVSVEVWDTGIGIPEAALEDIFSEYHQVDNPARERSRGLGLGLSIVRRLARLLGHRVRVRSRIGHGSLFAIEIGVPPVDATPDGTPDETPAAVNPGTAAVARPATVLVVEDDPDLRTLLPLLLGEEGYDTITAMDGPAALERIGRGVPQPDLILTDFNLPGAMDGLALGLRVREAVRRKIPVIVLTGDISTGTLREIGGQDCVQLSKPVRPVELIETIRRLLAGSMPPSAESFADKAAAPNTSGKPLMLVVDDDRHVRDGLRLLLEADGFAVEDYAGCEAFLEAFRPGTDACLLVDAYLPGMSGLDLLRHLQAVGQHLPAIMITGESDIGIAVQAMKAGASDFIEKPVGREELLASIARAVDQAREPRKLVAWRESAVGHMADLTPRQRQIMTMVLAGAPSKNIAADLNISQRTVENHRASIMKRTGAKSLPALARLVLAANWESGEEPGGA
jgi:two-component system CheB/CheR fusion protein